MMCPRDSLKFVAKRNGEQSKDMMQILKPENAMIYLHYLNLSVNDILRSLLSRLNQRIQYITLYSLSLSEVIDDVLAQNVSFKIN